MEPDPRSDLFFDLGVGPAVSWSPDGTSVGFAISTGARIALGARNTCWMTQGSPGCVGQDDTVYPAYLPRVRGGMVWTRDDTLAMPIGADLVIGHQHLHL